MPLQAKAAAFLIQRRAGSSSGVARVASHAIGRGPRRGNMQLSAILRAPTPSDARIVGSEADTSRYAAGVSHDVNSVTVEATANDSGAIVVFNAEDDAHIAAALPSDPPRRRSQPRFRPRDRQGRDDPDLFRHCREQIPRACTAEGAARLQLSPEEGLGNC